MIGLKGVCSATLQGRARCPYRRTRLKPRTTWLGCRASAVRPF